MKCLYCYKEAVSPFIMPSHASRIPNQKEECWWACDDCDVTFYYDKELLITNLYCTFKSDEKIDLFRITLSYKDNITELYAFFDYSDDPLCVFNKILNITPSNIKDKIKTLLVFL